MRIFERIERLENDMFERKINEKLKEYADKYKREFDIVEDYWHTYLVIDNNRHIYLGRYLNKEKVCEKLSVCENEIKAWLYDEMKNLTIDIEGEKTNEL